MLFDSVLRAHLEHGTLPWTPPHLGGAGPIAEDVEVEGNVVTPMALLEDTAPTCGRYWLRAAGRDRHHVRHESDAVCRGWRSAAERLEVRPASPNAGAVTAPRPRDAENLATLVDEARATSKGTTTPRLAAHRGTVLAFCDDYLSCEGPPVLRTGPDRRIGDSTLVAALPCCYVFARSCPSSPKRSGRWWKTDRSYRRLALARELDDLVSGLRRHRCRPAIYEWPPMLFEVRKHGLKPSSR